MSDMGEIEQRINRECQDARHAVRDMKARADRLELRAEQAELIVAALVRKFGEQVERDHAWRVALTEAELISLDDMRLRVQLDPMSGAMLIRCERPL